LRDGKRAKNGWNSITLFPNNTCVAYLLPAKSGGHLLKNKEYYGDIKHVLLSGYYGDDLFYNWTVEIWSADSDKG
jgi:hypothetical protein